MTERRGTPPRIDATNVGDGPSSIEGPHFFADPADVDAAGGTAVLRGDQAQHLAVVLRGRPGMPVSLADGTGRVYQASVRRPGDAEVLLELTGVTFTAPPTPRLVVVHGLPARRKLDDVVQRLSEIGVDRLVPVVTSRSQVRLDGDRAVKAVQRWRAVALAAGKQSRRARLLEVDGVGEWGTAFPPDAVGAVLWEQADRRLREVLEPGPAEVVLGVGPEGGLTEDEVVASGLPPASLGPTILRTETAALVGATAVLTLLGRLA